MLTRIEIDGFKTFENFSINLTPFSAVVGPNASGKSNLFDAMKLLSLLAQFDVRTAMQGLRGEPDELFRRVEIGSWDRMDFAIEVLLDKSGVDAFGSQYDIKCQRLRYEVTLALKSDNYEMPMGIFVEREACAAIQPSADRSIFARNTKSLYAKRKTLFINMRTTIDNEPVAFEIRQDGLAEKGGATKRGRPISLPAMEATRTALSTITTAEFPHLYALRDFLSSIRFLEINPQAARRPNDRFENKILRADASNLAAVLAHLQESTGTPNRRHGALSDISLDLMSMVPSVRGVKVLSDIHAKEYSFEIETAEGLNFSSRVISDGTLRLLALLSVLDDPRRSGTLCFEELENGIHEGRINNLIEMLRQSTTTVSEEDANLFQVLINTHSPAVMEALEESEIIAADAVTAIDPESRTASTKTRMRTMPLADEPINPENDLTRSEIVRLLKRQTEEV